ncbi:DUF559 domain-containing protein [Amnibacterium endophyticum]|uniref:DUF559 domain-containing protein n=1 Tax=Amnibacterium endophyticum TaxID=2109337 RepID=A0ABW4LC42_9MICO
MARNAPGLGDAFTYSDGLAAGLTPAELRHDSWAKPFHGVRAFTAPTTVVELAEHYAPKMPVGQFFSHTTAALLHGMWLPLVVEQRTEVHVAVRPGQRQPRGRGVRGHLLVDRPGLVTEVQGLPVARAEEAWCQLATVLGLDDLVIAGESLLAKGRPQPLTLHALLRAVRAGDRPRQSLLNRALPELRAGVRSPKETELRRLIVAAGLPEPLINEDVLDEQGRWIAECDLVYPQWRIVIEYEGELHFVDKAILLKDVHRYELLQALGWRVIRITKDDLAHRRDDIPQRIRAAIASRA